MYMQTAYKKLGKGMVQMCAGRVFAVDPVKLIPEGTITRTIPKHTSTVYHTRTHVYTVELMYDGAVHHIGCGMGTPFRWR